LLLLIIGQGGTISHEDTIANLTLFSREVLPRLGEMGGLRASALSYIWPGNHVKKYGRYEIISCFPAIMLYIMG
jgi:hypothetical protein